MIPFLLAAVCLLAVYLVYKAVTKKTLKFPYPPSPPGRFFWGNALDLPDVRTGRHPDIKLLEWAKEYGLVFSFKAPVIGRLIICADPDLVKHVLITKNFHKSWTYKTFTPIFGDRSIVITEGDVWFAQRRAFNPGFAPNFLKSMVTVISEKLDRFLTCINQDIDAGIPTHMLHRSQTFTSDVIVQIAFGEDWGGSKPHQAREWETELTELTSLRGNDPFVRLFGVRTRRRIRHVQNLLDTEMRAILERRLAGAAAGTTASRDICSIAIDQMKGPDGTLTEDDKITVIHQLKTFYFAGHDTTATLISWAIWLLSQHDEELEKLRNELKKQQIWAEGETPTYDQLLKCTYLEAILKEALRLYPPAGSGRYTSDVSETWGDYTIGGAILYVSPYVMHRHPDLWDRPDDFWPERFFSKTDNFATKWVAFSRGPRDCLGKYFAMLEAKMAVSALVLRYDLECMDPNEEWSYKVTAVPRNGAQVKFRHRKA